MEVRIGDREYEIADSCPAGAARRATLRRNLREHGLEAFLLSRKLGPYAGCIANDIAKAGADKLEDPSG